MTTHGSFRAQLRLPFNPEKQLLEAFAAGDAGAVVEETTTGWQLQHSLGRIALKPQSSNMDILLDAKDRTSLAYLQLGITHRLQSLDKNLDLDWQSDNTPGMLLPYFREMRVVSAENLTPFMKRVRLAGENLARFARGGLHMRLLFPPAGTASPSWPCIGKNGEAIWPDDENRPVARVYTIRAIDVDRGHVDVDMVLHEGDAYPGAGWAAQAKPGDIVGMTGPGGGEAPEAHRLVLLGDETALPAIARILEGLSSQTKAIVRVEVANHSETQPLATRAELDLEWLVRDDRAAGSTTLLEEAAKALPIKGDDPDLFVWAGCEFSAFKAIRGHLRKSLRLPNAQHLVVSYWRCGVAGVH
ncbi:siderophore-interacting protein [Nitratireductor rhodophyticola]|uniref:siderophore-interacting protein n=1 Tax=Nitratireductor rhodophyticola TaxID=2854036 RepID=UPI002AC958E8|nr:siderophore-interacting protein [Nitratireductor rhodophyticola]WPZ14688.1 siderophore-interacting protein [Nitratireductor rhodophyticola]